MKQLLILFILTSLINVVPADAKLITLSPSLTVLDSIGFAHNSRGVNGGNGGTAGVFVGTVAEVDNGPYKLLGLGGFLIQGVSQASANQNSSTAYAISFVPVSWFNDSIQFGYGWNFQGNTPIMTFGISFSQLAKQTGIVK